MQTINLYFIPVPNRKGRFQLYHITANGFLCVMSASDIEEYKSDSTTFKKEEYAITNAGYSIDKKTSSNEMRYFIKAKYFEDLFEWTKKNIKKFSRYKNAEQIEVFIVNGFNPSSLGVIKFS